MGNDDRIERARKGYERAVFGGDTSALVEAERGLDAVEADAALARGLILHARFQSASADTGFVARRRDRGSVPRAVLRAGGADRRQADPSCGTSSKR
jgi:hypothetical protein